MLVWRALSALAGLLALSSLSLAAPQTATFTSEVSTVSWPVADIDPRLAGDWSAAQFLVVEFRSSTSQRFELGLVSPEGNVSKRIHPFAGVWVRASIPLRYYRQGLGDADELASTVNQPRASYWINIEAGGHAPVQTVLQQTPSAHAREPQSIACVQDAPIAACANRYVRAKLSLCAPPPSFPWRRSC